MPDRTPEESRKAMATEINRQFNEAIDRGTISGAEKIPMPTDLTPPAPAPTAVAAVPEPVVPAPTAAPATPPVEPAKKIFDKYADLDAASKGYWNAVNTLSTTLDEKTRLEAENERLRGLQTQTVQPTVERPRVNPAARIDWARDASVVKASEATGIPAEVFAELAEGIHTQAVQGADQALAARLAPLQAHSEAESYMRAKYPESLNHTQELTNFIKATPTVAQAMNAMIQGGAPAQALEYAWKMYGVETGIGLTNKMNANAAVAEEAKVAARADAGVSATPNTPIHSVVPGSTRPSAEQIAWLKDRADQGDERAKVELRRVFLGQSLPAHMRTWEQQ